MDNLEKIVPVIIILISFIVSIVQNVKKEAAKKQQSAPKQTPVPPRRSQVPKPRIPEPRRETFPSRPVFQSARQTIEPAYCPGYDPEEIEKVVSVFSPEAENNDGENILVEEKVSPVNSLFNAQNTDEIKRAIIYTEILGRKYE
jgi:hypothetical protein